MSGLNRSPKERNQRKGDPTGCVPSLRYGQPAVLGQRAPPQNSLRCVAAPFGQLRRARQRSTGAPTPVPPRNRPAAGAASRGGTAEHPNSPSGHRCARPRLRGRKRLALRKPGRAQRSEAMARVDVRSPGSLQDVPRSAAGGVACVPQDTQASCSDLLRLSERRAQRKASSAAHPARGHRRLPAAERRDAACRVALSLVPFFRRRCSDRAHGKQVCGDIGNTSPWQTLPRRNLCPGNQDLS